MKLKIFYAVVLLLVSLQISFAQKIAVSGNVKDPQGEPLLGVLILIKGTTSGTSTNMDGDYKIEAKIGDVLEFSFLGMKTQERKITSKSARLDIILQDDIQELEGTVVVGYGAKKVASKTVASVAQVAGKEIAETPNANAMDALQGKVAGLVVNTETGKPGGSSSVLIHGLNSVSSMFAFEGGGVPEPLYILDGSPVGSNVMTTLNSGDIESITVLKDAASTSIYGARAANGVILITTKRGRKNERTSISINHQLGFSALTSVSRKFFDNLLTPQEYMDFWVENRPSVFAAGGTTDEEIKANARAKANEYLRQYPNNTRWDKVFYRDFVPISRTDVSVSGGSANTSYYLSFGYFDQEGTKPLSGYQRYTLNTNVDTQITKWLKAGISVSLSHNESQDSSSSTTDSKVLMLPIYSPIDKNGMRKDYIGTILGGSNGIYHPEYEAEKRPNSNFTQDILPIGYLQIEPIDNLVFKTQAGIQYNINESEDRNPLPSFVSYNGGTSIPQVARSIGKFIQKTYTNTLEYRFLYREKHNFNILFGQESIETTVKGFRATSQGQPSDGLANLNSGKQGIGVSDYQSVSTFNSFFSRLEYSFNDRYYLDLSGRRDGSSSFGKENQYGNFWAIGAMWKLKEESFLKNVNWLTDLNLRFSTGVSGSSGIGDYSIYNLISVDSNTYQGLMAYQLMQLGNPNLEWEEQRKTTIGVNAVIARNTSLNVEVYQRDTYGMLSTFNNNSMAGITSLPANIGSMENKGIDVTLSSVVYRNKANDISIRPYFNINYNIQKVTSIINGRSTMTNAGRNVGYKVGGALEWYMPIFKGIAQDGQYPGYAQWYLPGEDRMEQHTDDSQVSYQYDLETLSQTTGKKRQAPVNGGFGLNINYKAFSLDMSFSFSAGKYLMNEDKRRVSNPGSFGMYNFSRDVIDHWKQPGDDTIYPKIDSNIMAFLRNDTRILEDASFIRMKSISLSYTLPQQVVEQIKFFNGLRLFASARNIFTLTKYTGADPEFASTITTGGYPPSRQFTLGVELKF
ncbi:MAG: SusC/RagA family TonB-linked outer membrane protein [Capnocytophaga sp.]|nr:SusC/RagA family TonB-linked outer membrane protein [Capnocytophaga sp.]